MKLKKINSLLATILFLSSFNLQSFAGVLSEDGRYETFEGSSFKIDNIMEAAPVDIEIHGNTMVNAIGEFDTPSYATVTGNTLYFQGQTNKLNAQFKNSTLKENTEYTIFYNITKNTLTPESNNRVIKFNLSNHSAEYGRGWFEINAGDIGQKKRLVTISDSIAHRPYLETRIATTGEFEIKDIMAIEGNHLDKDVEYFKGIQSVGENDADGHSFNIEVNNKNLFRKWNDGYINSANGEDTPHVHALRTDYIQIDSKKKYRISGLYNQVSSFVAFYDSNYTYIDRTTGNPRSSIQLSPSSDFIIPPKCKYIRLTQYPVIDYTATREDILENTKQLQIEEGEVRTDYIKHESNLLNIESKEPLRSIHDGVKDKIVKKNNKWYIERNTKKITLNGDENWEHKTNIFEQDINSSIIGFEYLIPNFFINSPDIISTTLPVEYEWEKQIYKSIRCWVNSYETAFVIVLNKSDLSNPDTSGFKEWLKLNNIDVVVPLKEPIYEPISLNDITLFEGTTYISNNSNIPTNIKITVDRTANRAIEAIEIAKSNPILENISLARMWINLLDDSTLKDSFQDTVGEITEVVDLTIDKKKVSANLDVYIKSANSLTMSLSTNSITFENYSGVESMEKLSAVNITVNSSLPYELNAYMPTPMSSSDGKTMAMNVVNIKDNSEANYSQFVNTTDKVVLKGDCNAGDNNIHNIDLKLSGGNLHEADVYRTVLKFEAVQK